MANTYQALTDLLAEHGRESAREMVASASTFLDTALSSRDTGAPVGRVVIKKHRPMAWWRVSPMWAPCSICGSPTQARFTGAGFVPDGGLARHLTCHFANFASPPRDEPNRHDRKRQAWADRRSMAMTPRFLDRTDLAHRLS